MFGQICDVFFNIYQIIEPFSPETNIANGFNVVQIKTDDNFDGLPLLAPMVAHWARATDRMITHKLTINSVQTDEQWTLDTRKLEWNVDNNNRLPLIFYIYHNIYFDWGIMAFVSSHIFIFH